MRQYHGRKVNALHQPREVVRRQAFWWYQMRELQRRNESDSKANVACAGSQIIVPAGKQGGPGTIELKCPLARFMQLEIALRNAPPHAKPCAARHGFGQARQVGPGVVVEFADDEIPPITTRPFRRWLLEPRSALPAPRTQERLLFGDQERRFKEIAVKHIVVVNEDEQITSGLAHSPQTRRCQAELAFSNHVRLWMPRKVGQRGLVRGACVIDKN